MKKSVLAHIDATIETLVITNVQAAARPGIGRFCLSSKVAGKDIIGYLGVTGVVKIDSAAGSSGALGCVVKNVIATKF